MLSPRTPEDAVTKIEVLIVMPHFTGQFAGPVASCHWVRGSGPMLMERAAHAIDKSIQDHAAEQGSQAIADERKLPAYPVWPRRAPTSARG